MQNYPPQIELIPTANQGFATDEPPVWHRAPRARLFILVFVVISAVGLAYTFGQERVYQSRASILMAALTAIDRGSADADIQHVAIQRRILLGNELMTRTRSLLIDRGYTVPEQLEFGNMLGVEPVEDTNLVEMVAQGTEADLLSVLIDTWIEVYLAARAADIAQSLGDTHRVISDEVGELQLKIETARQELADFRAENNIVSAERAENEALARLKGINKSLNKALEDEVRAKSNLDAIQEAVARGETVVPRAERPTLSKMELELQRLKMRLAELDQRYTREYLARQPSLKVLPEQIATLELEVSSRGEAGREVVISEATQAWVAAQKTVENIRQQYAEHKQAVEHFTQIFQIHQARLANLENLEELHRESQSRLVQLETSQVQRYPQVSVIAAATVAKRVGPNYLLNAAIALGVALVAAIFAVWLRGFLGHQKKDLPPITVTGVRLYPDDGRDGLAYQSTHAALDQKAHALEKREMEEGSVAEDRGAPAPNDGLAANDNGPQNK